jgi:hypothetical protein
MANGLLDFLKTPEGQGLLGAVAGTLATAQRNAPVNTLGRGALAGMSAYGGALDRQSQEAERVKQNEMRDMQMAQLKQQQQREAQRQQLLPTLFAPQVSEPTFTESPTGMPVLQTPSIQGAPKFDVQKAIQSGLFNPQEIESYAKLPDIGKPKREVFKPGDVVYEGGKQVISIPKEQDLPSAVKEYQFAVAQGYKGPFQQFQLEQKRAGASVTNVNMSQEKEQAKVVGKEFGQQYVDLQKSGVEAQNKINRFDRLNQLLEGVNTGKFTPIGVEVAKAAQSLGFSIDANLQNKEAASALSGEMALQLRNPSGGAGMPGAMSDKDREFLQQMTPGLATTAAGRKMMSDTVKKLAKRDIEVAKMARDYRKKTGSLDEGFYDELQTFSAKNPLFQTQPANTGGSDLFNQADSIIRGGR